MTPEERFERIEQKIEFIVNQQAQFSVDLANLQARFSADLQQLREQVSRLTDASLAMMGMIGKLAEAQARTDAKVAALAEKGAETEERLNVLIGIVERSLSQRHDDQRPAED
jgi:hypothetical protein